MLPARAAGLDPKQPHPRQDVIDALIQRVQKACKPTAVRETSGFLIVTAPRKTHLEVSRFLDDLDENAMHPQDKP